MTRPRTGNFFELIDRQRRGRPEVYIGFAAGVGKTYRRLKEAHALAKRGVDVVDVLDRGFGLGLPERHRDLLFGELALVHPFVPSPLGQGS